MQNTDDSWLWFIDDAPLQALLKAEGEIGTMKMRAASSPVLVHAVASHLEGHSESAIDSLRKAIAAGDRDPDIFVFLGQLEFESGDLEQAAATFQQLGELDLSHPNADFNRAVCLEKLSRWSDAASAFRAASANPDLPIAWLGLGLCLLHQRKPEQALQAFESFLRHQPDHESALFGQAVALQMLRRFDEAEAIYRRFNCDLGDSPELLINLLALAVAKKDVATVGTLSAQLERLRPGSRQTREVAVQGALSTGDWDAALAHLTKLSSSAPVSEEWEYATAWCQYRTGRFAEAAGTVERLLEANPTFGPAHMLAAALAELENPDEAVSIYERAVQTLSRPAPAWWNLARLHAAAGDPSGCRKAADSLRAAADMPAEASFASGLAFLAESDPRQAASEFRDALKHRPSWAQAKWNLGLALWASGDSARAVEPLRQARRELPDSTPSEPLVAALLDAGSLDSAYAELQSASSSANSGDPSPQLIFNVALGLHRAGRMDQAESLYRLALGKDDSFAEAYVNLGHLLLATGRPDEAHVCWQTAASMPAACSSLN